MTQRESREAGRWRHFSSLSRTFLACSARKRSCFDPATLRFSAILPVLLLFLHLFLRLEVIRACPAWFSNLYGWMGRGIVGPMALRKERFTVMTGLGANSWLYAVPETATSARRARREMFNLASFKSAGRRETFIVAGCWRARLTAAK